MPFTRFRRHGDTVGLIVRWLVGLFRLCWLERTLIGPDQVMYLMDSDAHAASPGCDWLDVSLNRP